MGGEVEYRIEIIVERDGMEFHAYCPALKGLHAAGKTKKEAVDNAFELAKLYLISLIKHNEPIPVGTTISTTTQDEIKACKNPEVDCIVKDFALAHSF